MKKTLSFICLCTLALAACGTQNPGASSGGSGTSSNVTKSNTTTAVKPSTSNNANGGTRSQANNAKDYNEAPAATK